MPDETQPTPNPGVAGEQFSPSAPQSPVVGGPGLTPQQTPDFQPQAAQPYQQPNPEATTPTPNPFAPGAAPFTPSSTPYTAPQPAYGQPTVGQPTYAPGNPFASPAPKRRRMPVVAALVVAAVVAAATFAILHFSSHHITTQDVVNASQTISTLNNDMDDLSFAMSDMSNANTVDEFNTNLATANTKLADAKKQYAALKKSNVLHDKAVGSKFKTLNAKWDTYITYAEHNISDLKAIEPPLLQFETDAENLAKNEPTSLAGLGTYLTSFKQTVDGTSQKIKDVKLTEPNNQKILTALQEFLKDTSSSIAKAQSDLNAGKDAFTVEEDLFAVSDAESGFSDSVYSIEKDINTYEQKIDPFDQLLDVQKALSTLQYSIKS